MRRPLATLPTVAFLAIALGATARLEACSCTNDPTLEEQVASASMVFSGLVTDIQPAGDKSNVLVTITPLRRWKGGLDNPVLVATGMDVGVCGVTFVVGSEYLVFAYPVQIAGQQRPFTHSCTRTALAENNPDVTNLGPPLIPTAVRSLTWGGVKLAWR